MGRLQVALAEIPECQVDPSDPIADVGAAKPESTSPLHLFFDGKLKAFGIYVQGLSEKELVMAASSTSLCS